MSESPDLLTSAGQDGVRTLRFEDPNRRKQYVEFRAFIDAYKMDRGCIRCGFAGHPAALSLDHRDPLTKVVKVSSMFSYSWEKILAEVDKCDVMCANCHQIKSYEEDQNGAKAKARLMVTEVYDADWTLFDGFAASVR